MNKWTILFVAAFFHLFIYNNFPTSEFVINLTLNIAKSNKDLSFLVLNYEGFFSIVVFLTYLVITVQRNDTQYNLHKGKINKFFHLLPNIKRKLAAWVYFLGRRFLNFSFQIIFYTLILLRGIVSNSTKNKKVTYWNLLIKN